MRLPLFMLTLATLAVGCASSSSTSSKAQVPVDRVDTPTAGTVERPSNLSYGTVTATVKKDTTTQMELLNLFGGPNISTTDADGLETWVYERTASVNDTAGNAESKNFEAFFGGGATIGAGAVGGGAAGGARSSSDARRTVNSVRTLTVVVKFNPNKTVKDVSTRASYF